MIFNRDDLRIGLLVLGAIGLFVALLFHRAMTRLVATEVHQYVRLQDALEVPVGTQVMLQGVPVGKVKAVGLERKGTEYEVTARLGIRPDIVLWEGTAVKVNSRAFGGGYLELRLPPPGARVRTLVPDSTLPSSPGASLNDAIQEVQALVQNLNVSVEALRDHFQRRGAGALLDHPAMREVLLEMRRALQGHGQLAEEGSRLIRKADPAVESLARSAASVEKTLSILDKRHDDLDAMAASLIHLIREAEGLATQLNSGSKTLLPEAEATLEALHRNLRATEELVALLQQKPRRLVFGTPTPAEREAAARSVDAARKKPQ